MVRKIINPNALQKAGLDSFVDIDIFELDASSLKDLDVWVDRYNHNISADAGISSSMLLSLLVIEELIDQMVATTVVSNTKTNDFDQFVSTIKEENEYLIGLSRDQVLHTIVFSSFVSKNPQLDRIQHLSISSTFEDDRIQTFSNHLDEILGDEDTLITPFEDIINQYPDSLEDQLQHLIEVLGVEETFKPIVLKTIDLIKEQTKFRGGGPGEIQLPSYDDFYPEAYSQDKKWMPKVVVLAKHTKVWLNQLSRKYDRSITKLDEIPDDELKEIVDRGFTGLWLIGIWERSTASRKIKERMGNSDAAASAYSLWDYIIADDLGGHEAYYILSERAGKLGLRLASDMVPNHTGILSKWIIEHPDWFIQTREPPFPSYQFKSEDLSDHPHVNIYLEDHYYSHSDASVVFKRVDAENNDVRYIYHGNDGTSIPWNDTAQLDFLKQEVRQNVINTILHVAKMFPIIRLDAAMVLTKKHFQRLWYPVPGTGGDIPSRSRYGISHEKFEELFPVEFWREVVDRIEQDAPETLLVAEAFWMLEGYFVRTLGVHRVYNSAFMHMLRDQKNEEYRGLIKSTLTYDPRILQRYVNFMSNPDEDTAIEQFDNGDKYFGCTIMMITLPGMPMFGHGQVEGFREKYGMEFQRDYWNEEVDANLVDLHKQLIFPVLQKRYLFAQVDWFRLYDVYHPDGWVIENIFAYTNRVEDEFVLVIYNNAMDSHSGWIKTTLPFNGENLSISTNTEYQSNLAEELTHLSGDNSGYCIFKNFYDDQYFLRSMADIRDKGLFIQLNGYQFQIFSDFQLIEQTDLLDDYYDHNDQSMIEKEDLPSSIRSILDQ